METFVGIDIASKNFDVVIRKNGINQKVETFQQTAADIEKLIGKLKPISPTAVVMEATGIYYVDLARSLYSAGLPVSVINPKSFRHFAELMLKRTKTDAVDAGLLAEYGQRMEPQTWEAPSQHLVDLRDVARQINRLTHMKVQSKNRLHALRATKTTSAMVIESEQDVMDFLELRIERMRQHALELIAADERLNRQLENITRAKGIAENSAICMMGELNVMPLTLKAPQVVHHAGLSVRQTQSGSSVNSPGRLSKAGNTYLRSALFMPSLAAGIHDPNAKAFKEALVARGKKKIQAQCALMRKYLMGVWACIKNDTPFDSAKLFSPEHKKACI